MAEKYKGYSINTEWNGKAMGFDFFVRSEDGAEVSRSETAYFYEENARAAAKAAVDCKVEEEGGKDEYRR